MQRGSVPEGRSKSLSAPQIFVVETEPRHEQATARRMLMPLQKRQVFLFVEKFGSDDVRPDLIKLRSVQSSRWDGAIFLMIPGTSCQATMVLSLRDKSHSPIEVPHNYLSAYEGLPWVSQNNLLSHEGAWPEGPDRHFNAGEASRDGLPTSN